MNKVKLCKYIFAGLSCFMIWLVIATSLKSNLFEVLPNIGSQPWFVTTLYDFYFNIAIISAWVFYREKNVLTAFGWVISFILLGSITTCLYVFLQILSLKPNESFDKAIVRKV